MAPAALPPRVLLVSPPWTSLNEPSLGLGLLRAVLDRHGIASRVLHLNLFALDLLRGDTYNALADVYGLNDFLFSGILDPSVTSSQRRLLWRKCAELFADQRIDHRRHGGIPGVIQHLLHLRETAIPDWVQQHVDAMLAWQPTVVGFTCMFDQTIASAAIAARLKQTRPDLLIALGGYAVREPTGSMLLQAFPWIDCVCTGEGEPCIVELAQASVRLPRHLQQVPNLLYRDAAGQIARTPSAPLVEMNSLPDPNFDDFISDLRQLRDTSRIEVLIDRLPVENSRGCWWGAAHHCVFCGIHDDDLHYRARSANAVLASLDRLSRRYGSRGFRFADYIMPQQYYATLLPRLAALGAPYHIKCELKANITGAQARQLAAAGFVEVQPGIESFSTPVLTRMDKGVSGIQNVYLLLLGRRHGIVILYNLLFGLPDDDMEAYAQMVRQLPRLVHLAPPANRTRMLVTRYAPMQTQPQRFALRQTGHEPSYELIFSPAYLRQTGFDLDRYCYIFASSFEPPPRLSRLYREIDRLCADWKAAYCDRAPSLLYELKAEGRMTVNDQRGAAPCQHQLDADASAVMLAADHPRTLEALAKELPHVSDLETTIAALDAAGLIYQDNHRILSLALPRKGIAPRRLWSDNYEQRWQTLPDKLARTS